MKPEEARKLISKLVKKYDRNYDGKFNYAGMIDAYIPI
jgi:hypothetical protein